MVAFVAVATVLAIAAGSKVMSPDALQRWLRSAGVPVGLVGLATFAVVAVEVALAALLLWRPGRPAAVGACLLSAVFVAIQVRSGASRSEACGCLPIVDGHAHGLGPLVRAVLVFGLSLLALSVSPGQLSYESVGAGVAVAVIVVLIASVVDVFNPKVGDLEAERATLTRSSRSRAR